MATFLHPGVFVREIPGGTRAIEGVPTSTTIFVGEAERGPLTPTRINGRTQYERIFGGYLRRVVGATDHGRVLLPYALDGFFGNGGTQAYVLRAIDEPLAPSGAATAFRVEQGGAPPGFVEAASPGAWGNDVWVAVVASTDNVADHFRLNVFYFPPGAPPLGVGEVPDQVEDWDRLSIDPTDENYVIDILRRSSYIRWRTDPLTELPVTPGRPPDDPGGTPVALGAAGGGGDGVGGNTASGDPDYTVLLDAALAEIDDAALLVCAGAQLLPDGGLDAQGFLNIENVFVDYANNRPRLDLFFVGDLPRLTRGSSVLDGEPVSDALIVANGRLPEVPNPLAGINFIAAYWPHVEVRDPVGEGRNPTLVIPPAGHVAASTPGLMAAAVCGRHRPARKHVCKACWHSISKCSTSIKICSIPSASTHFAAFPAPGWCPGALALGSRHRNGAIYRFGALQSSCAAAFTTAFSGLCSSPMTSVCGRACGTPSALSWRRNSAMAPSLGRRRARLTSSRSTPRRPRPTIRPLAWSTS